VLPIEVDERHQPVRRGGEGRGGSPDVGLGAHGVSICAPANALQ
jgi:hypothetical protein